MGRRLLGSRCEAARLAHEGGGGLNRPSNVLLARLPAPVAARDAGYVHARFVTKAEDILQRHHDHARIALERLFDQPCPELARGLIVIRCNERARAMAHERRRVVRGGVEHLAGVRMQPVSHIVVGELEHVHAGETA